MDLIANQQDIALATAQLIAVISLLIHQLLSYSNVISRTDSRLIHHVWIASICPRNQTTSHRAFNLPSVPSALDSIATWEGCLGY